MDLWFVTRFRWGSSQCSFSSERKKNEKEKKKEGKKKKKKKKFTKTQDPPKLG